MTAKIDKRYHKLQALANGGENRTATPETANNNRGGKLAKRVNRRIDRHAKLARQYTERISELEERRLEDIIYTAERRATRLRGQAEALNWQINSHEQNRDSAGAVSKKTTRQLAKTISRKSSLADWKLANARQEEARAARIRHKSQE